MLPVHHSAPPCIPAAALTPNGLPGTPLNGSRLCLATPLRLAPPGAAAEGRDLTPSPLLPKERGVAFTPRIFPFCFISPPPRPFSLQGRRGNRSRGIPFPVSEANASGKGAGGLGALVAAALATRKESRTPLLARRSRDEKGAAGSTTCRAWKNGRHYSRQRAGFAGRRARILIRRVCGICWPYTSPPAPAAPTS